jgi:DNA-binding IclR family transcriptional regulator
MISFGEMAITRTAGRGNGVSRRSAKSKYTVPAVQKSFAVIEMFAANNTGHTLSEVSRCLKLPISTSSSLLYTMQQAGYLRRDETGHFFLSMKIVVQANKIIGQIQPRAVAKPALRKLTDSTGLTSVLAVLDMDQLVWIEKIEGTGHITLAAQVGKRMHLHHTSTGKAILAHLPPEQVQEIVESAGLVRVAPKTITSLPALRKELAIVRARGYAVDDEETAPGIRGVASPVFDHRGKLVGAVGVGGAIFEFDGMKSIIAAVEKCASEVSEKLGYREAAVVNGYLA